LAVLLLAVSCLLNTQSVGPQRLTTPAVIEFDHDGRDVKGFVLYATRKEDGVQKRIDVGMPAKAKSGRLQITLPALPKGTWRLELAAYNSAGESARAMADPFEVRLEDEAPRPASTVKSPPQPKAAPKSPPGASPPPPQKPPPPAPKKKGGLGKLWRFIVGDDGP
jgi:hypothetical protein